MPGLRNLELARAYHKPEDDIAREFYLPALAAATRYDRAVGYFSSAIFLLAWPSLKAFAGAGGKMRLICSPILSDGDHDAMRSGYDEKVDQRFAEELQARFEVLLRSRSMMKPATVLASLVASGVIEVKIAWLGEMAGGRPRRLFHDKVGILTDADGAKVAFKGSMNETWPGLALDGNLESVDVYADWRDDGERSRVADEETYFDRLWDDDWPGVTVQDLPDSARAAIVSAADAARWGDYVDEICIELERAARWSPESGRADGRMPRPHQVDALEAWKARDRRGIFEQATGSGKTFTALCAISDSLRRGEMPIIVVPSTLLLDQWEAELRSVFADAGLQLLICGSGHARWREGARLRTWTRLPTPGQRPRAVLATLQTASGQDFLDLTVQGSHLMLVADEVHRLGASQARRLLDLDTGPRLGLSATPKRAGDAEGTDAILKYFHGIVPPPYTLRDAIAAGTLTPYAYHVHEVTLDESERANWVAATRKLSTLVARSKSAGNEKPGLHARIKTLLIQRARIVKGASGKIAASASILRKAFEPGQRWIVYCDDQGQLSRVKQTLRGTGLPDVYEYHSSMEGDKARTLSVFEERGGILVSIRCLDEGVDIPAVSHALILASSRNPREFVQRRGRVLRRHEGKLLAHVHDVLVTPADAHDAETGSILAAEIARAIEFGQHAMNPACVADLKRIAAKFGIADDAALGGFEADDEDQGEKHA